MRGKAGLFCRRSDFTPLQIAGLTGWWDSSDAATLYDEDSGGSLVAPDGTIGRIVDKSGAGRNWVQPSSSFRPTRRTAVKNALDVVRFDGSDDRMSSGFYFDDIVAAGAYTIFAVAKATTASFDDGTDPVNNEFILAETSGGYGAFYLRSSNKVGAMGFEASPGTSPDFAEATYTIGNWAYFTQQWDGADLAIRVNGGAASSTASDDLYDFNTPATLGFQDYSDTFFEGDLGELVVYNVALSQADREAVESYLANKWDIP